MRFPGVVLPAVVRRHLPGGLLVALAVITAWPSQAHAAKPTAKEAKVGIYVEMLNSESNYIFDNQATYSKWVDMKVGPTCKEIGLRQPSSVGESAPDRYAHYRKELAKKPKLDADDGALQMVEALEQLRLPVNEASDYYFTRKFTQDACKRGKELHPLLIAGWSKFVQGDAIVRTFVEKFNDEREAADLVDIQKKFGNGLHLAHRKLSIEAKVVVRVVEAQGHKEKPEAAAIKDKLAAFVQTLGDAGALVAKEKGGKNADALYQGGYEQLLTKAGWFKDAVDALVKEFDSEAADPQTSHVDERKRAFKQAIDSYNSLVDQSNGVMYSRGMK